MVRVGYCGGIWSRMRTTSRVARCVWLGYYVLILFPALENRGQICSTPAMPGLESCIKNKNARSMWMVDGRKYERGVVQSKVSICEDGPDEV